MLLLYFKEIHMKKLIITIIILTLSSIKCAEIHPWSKVTIASDNNWIILSTYTATEKPLKITACYRCQEEMYNGKMYVTRTYDATVNGKSLSGIRNKSKLLFNKLLDEYRKQQKQ